MKGDNYEREFIDVVSNNEWYAMRAPASGRANPRDLPDVIVSRDGEPVYAVEVKASSAEVRETEDKWDALLRFAEGFGAEPRFACRLKRDTSWYVIDASAVDRTYAGNLHLTQDSVRSKGIELREEGF